jgi:hypothetical protein
MTGLTGFLDRRSPVFARRAMAMAGMPAVAEPMMSALGGDTIRSS